MSMPPRTAALAGLAFLLVALALLWPESGPRSESAADGPAEADAAPAGEPAPEGAPRDLDAQGLSARYRPIIEARPFAPRSFKPAPPPPPGRRPEPRARTPEPTASPTLELRFTAMLGQGPQRVAVLEQSGSGKGILAAAGQRLGAVTVAAVHTESVLLEEEGKRREVALGDGVRLPLEASSALTQLHSIQTVTRGADGAQLPQLGEDERARILERLRQRRQQSIGGGGPPAGEGGAGAGEDGAQPGPGAPAPGGGATGDDEGRHSGGAGSGDATEDQGGQTADGGAPAGASEGK